MGWCVCDLVCELAHLVFSNNHTSNVEKYSHVVGESVLLNLKNHLKINWPSVKNPYSSPPPPTELAFYRMTLQMQKLGSKERDPLINRGQITSFVAQGRAYGVSWGTGGNVPTAWFPAHRILKILSHCKMVSSRLSAHWQQHWHWVEFYNVKDRGSVARN